MLRVVENTAGTLYLDVDSTLETLVCTGTVEDAQWLLDQKIPDFKDWKYILTWALWELSTSDGTINCFRIEVRESTRITATVSYENGKSYEYMYPKGNLSVVE